MDLLNRVSRAEEEAVIVRNEMSNVVKTYKAQHTQLAKVADSLMNELSSAQSRGMLNVVMKKICNIEEKCKEATQKFRRCIECQPLVAYSNHLIVREVDLPLLSSDFIDSDDYSDYSDIPSDYSDIDF